MGSVIKKSEFISVTGSVKTEVMRTPLYAETRSIDNGERKLNKPAEAVEEIVEEIEEAPVISEEELEQQRIREEKLAEFEQLKQQYIDESERLLNEARIKAAEILEDAGITAQILKESAEKECVGIKKAVEEKGYSDGFAAGREPGFEEGYNEGLRKCKETLIELNSALGRFPEEKEQIFRDYENQLFDLIFTISNKITVGSLKQKDKAVISKMLKEAAKAFRGSSYIKVSLSKLDIEESVNVDLDDLNRIFGINQHVEFEILKDAPKGTMILDNGSEIADAGILTQLKMIENLGKGKFKNKPDDEDDGDDFSDISETGGLQ
ncbi:MAG: hypothetical protein FWD34_03315 [Oscillospiraceae bacterium]|nr:hypothetical protein [Oscillospiraceae bacterium]